MAGPPRNRSRSYRSYRIRKRFCSCAGGVHVIHADLAGKKRELPKDKPFPEERKEGKK